MLPWVTTCSAKQPPCSMEREQIIAAARNIIREHYPEHNGEGSAALTTLQVTEIINNFSGFELTNLETYQILTDLEYSKRKIGRDLYWCVKAK